MTMLIITVHGYSMLRTQMNNDYFHDLFDESAKFGIEIEGHRESIQICDPIFLGWPLGIQHRYGNRTRRLRDSISIHIRIAYGR